MVLTPVNVWAACDTSAVQHVCRLHTLDVSQDGFAVLEPGSAVLVLGALQRTRSLKRYINMCTPLVRLYKGVDEQNFIGLVDVARLKDTHHHTAANARLAPLHPVHSAVARLIEGRRYQYFIALQAL